jgi:His-Xaa-Ser system protein HxsD
MEIGVKFSVAAQDRAALDAAAYRLIGSASCQIELAGEFWDCRLTAVHQSKDGATITSDELRSRFLDLVTDENLRVRVAAKTDRVRDVILALAFGALAAEQAKI